MKHLMEYLKQIDLSLKVAVKMAKDAPLPEDGHTFSELKIIVDSAQEACSDVGRMISQRHSQWASRHCAWTARRSAPAVPPKALKDMDKAS